MTNILQIVTDQQQAELYDLLRDSQGIQPIRSFYRAE
jgi:hypothetical protein